MLSPRGICEAKSGPNLGRWFGVAAIFCFRAALSLPHGAAFTDSFRRAVGLPFRAISLLHADVLLPRGGRDHAAGSGPVDLLDPPPTR